MDPCTMCGERPATTEYGLPVCDECKAMCISLDAKLKEMEAADPELAKLGQSIEETTKALLSRIIPCDWGREVGLPEDTTVCPEVAERVVVIHDPDNPAFELELRLCPGHDFLVRRHTDPRSDPCTT